MNKKIVYLDSASTYGLELAEGATGFPGTLVSRKSARKDMLFILNMSSYQHFFSSFI